MKRRSGLTLAAIILVMGATTPRAQDEGFTPLFNSKESSGSVYGRRSNGSANRTGKGYQVKNGVLLTTKEDGGDLFTEKQYADFVLRFDFKLTENANNGIGIRAPLVGKAHVSGWKSRCSTTATTNRDRDRRSITAPSIRCYRPRADIRSRSASERQRYRAGAEGRREAERSDHHGRRSGRREGRSAPGPTPGPEQARRIARHRQHYGAHRPARPRRRIKSRSADQSALGRKAGAIRIDTTDRRSPSRLEVKPEAGNTAASASSGDSPSIDPCSTARSAMKRFVSSAYAHCQPCSRLTH